MIEKIVSGGQTGVDRAALDVALEHSVPCGGWCPNDRKAEDGPIPPCYPLQETPSREYAQRTEWNVRDSDGTLVLGDGPLTAGTAHTVEIAKQLGKPCLVLDLTRRPNAAAVCAWAIAKGIRTLNVAGPRESKSLGIYAHAAQFLREVLVLSQLRHV